MADRLTMIAVGNDTNGNQHIIQSDQYRMVSEFMFEHVCAHRNVELNYVIYRWEYCPVNHKYTWIEAGIFYCNGRQYTPVEVPKYVA